MDNLNKAVEKSIYLFTKIYFCIIMISMQKDDFLKVISERIEESNLIKNTRKMLSERSSVSLGEVGGVAKVLLVQSLSVGSSEPTTTKITTKEETGKKTIYLTENIDEAKKYFEDWGIDFIVGTRHALSLREEKNIILSSFSDIFQKVISHEEYKGRILNIKVGDKLDLVWLANNLVESGYENIGKRKRVDEAGEFQIKGDFLEIFADKKYRVEFFGDQVEKIVGAGLPRPEKQGAETAPLREMEIFPFKIPEGDDFLIQYFENYLFIIDGEDNFRSYILTLFSRDGEEAFQGGVEKLKEIEDFIKKQKVVYLENFAVDEKKGINLHWFESKKFNGNTAEFLRYLKSESKPEFDARINPNIKKQIFIFSEKADQVKKFLVNNAMNVDGKRILVEKRKISEGVDFSDLGLVVFSDKEIFGEIKPQRGPLGARKRKKVDFSAITNLKKGEYVVHIDHGIGKFTGFGEISIDGIRREYIFIEYDKGDKIYVPIDQADKITKYIAVTNSPPHLSNLKTGNWIKIRKKVRENAEKVAKELIEAQAARAGEKSFYYVDDGKEQRILEKTFAYPETPDQKKTIEDVLEDMSKRLPMDRIICGDVGYGKTEVAIRAATRAVISGGQAVVLVPTTILAEQHLQTFRERLDQLGFKIESLSRFVKTADQKKIVDKIQNGGVDIVIGTHRLLSRDIKFKNLYLAIIDEEQKFGVKHKEKLKNLRAKVDILTLTATPIPRTLYLGLGGLKDISLIQTPPEGRLPIKTVVIKNDDEIIKDAISKEVERNGQVYFVHNRVETILAFAAKLKKLLPQVKFAVAHGQMKEEKLAQIMNDFANGKYDCLICSTIIESGLDISSVNTLIVDKATNFGLSQLHQLRGRIGRSSVQAYAYFLFDSDDLVGNAKRRLSAISEKEALGSGYELSLEDLNIRGSGNILGEEQSGSMQMVGVGYYLRLLEEAVEKIKGEETEKVSLIEIKIDLPLSAYIPNGFYKKEEDKIKAYQVLAGFENLEEVNDFENGLVANGELPVEYKNLIEIVRLKIKAKEVGIKSIIVKDVLGIGEIKIKKLYLEFDHVLNPEEVKKIFALNRHWYFGNMLVKIDLKDLGTDWLKKIFLTVENLRK